MTRFIKSLLLIVGILMLLWLVRLSFLVIPPRDGLGEKENKLNSARHLESIQKRLIIANTNLHSHDLFKLWGLAVPNSALPFFQRAIRSAEFVEFERRRLGSGTGSGLLEGLQRKLFMDDYAYAALATKELDPGLAEYCFGKVAEALTARQIVTIPTPASTAMPVLDKEASQKFIDHYKSFFTSPNPGYSNVYTQLTGATSANVLVNDLFKDGCLYVGLQTQLIDWRERERKDDEFLLKNQIAHIFDPAKLAIATNSFLDITEKQEFEWKQLQSAYRNIFAFRFRDRHGIDPEVLIPKLDQLELKNSGPELRIPE